jgi:hypothetical protein
MSYDVFFDGVFVGATDASDAKEACDIFGGENNSGYTASPTEAIDPVQWDQNRELLEPFDEI